MKRVKYEFILEAVTPIAHHASTIGNFSALMRAKVRRPAGGFVEVPVVTADTMRHGLREAAAYAFLDAAGLLDERPSLSEAALRLLFAGGMVTGKGDASKVNLTAFQRACELVPTLALLGGCSDSRVIPGRFFVQDAVLVCSETEHMLPEWAREAVGELESSRSHVEVPTRVRMDPTLDPGKRKLLTPEASTLVDGRMELSELAHEERDSRMQEAAKSSTLPRSFERLVVGSRFYWCLHATTHSELDLDTLHVTLGSFLSRAVVGGKKGTGHGLMRAVPGAARNIDVLRPAEGASLLDIERRKDIGEAFRAHVGKRKKEIREWLAGVDA